MNNKRFIAAVAAIGFAAALDANALTFTFQENGVGNLGVSSSPFTESGFSLTATAFGPGSPTLWVKHDGGDENGLGLSNDTDHEIKPGSFIQLSVPTTPPTTLNWVIAGSVQTGEQAVVYFTTTAGSLTGATQIGTLNSDGTISITSPYNTEMGYIDITAGAGNVLLDSVSVTVPSVPDGGMTVAMLGGALTLLGFARRKLVA